MPKISDETKQLVTELFEQGLCVAEIARKTNVPYAWVYTHTRLKEREFNSINEYNEHCAKLKKFGSLMNYQEYRVKLRGHESFSEYRKHRIRLRGFQSTTDYQNYLNKQKQKRSKNQKLGNLIKRRLSELERNQSWLAKKLGITRQAISLYTKGSSVPNDNLLEKLCYALEVNQALFD